MDLSVDSCKDWILVLSKVKKKHIFVILYSNFCSKTVKSDILHIIFIGNDV